MRAKAALRYPRRYRELGAALAYLGLEPRSRTHAEAKLLRKEIAFVLEPLERAALVSEPQDFRGLGDGLVHLGTWEEVRVAKGS